MIDWSLTWTTVSAIATAIMSIAIVATAIYAGFEINYIRKARYSTLLMGLLNTWESVEFTTGRRLVNSYYYSVESTKRGKNFTEQLKELDSKDDPKYYSMIKVFNFFENLGQLICEKHLERDQSINLFGSAARSYWNYAEDYIMFHRTSKDNPQLDAWKYFEYLAFGCPQKNRCLGLIKTPDIKLDRLD